jgi:DeoR family transcriptional regulator, aga operon transcriptional repressor
VFDLQQSAGRTQAETRRQRIFEYVRANGFASVSDLAVLESVSEMTIRRDIQALAGRHLLRQVHGGANAILDAGEGIDFRLRVSKHAETKKAIATAALQFVRPRATIALDSGTTTLELARQLPSGARLLVATHSLPALMALSRTEGTDVVGLGGAFQSHTQSFAGPMALTAIRHLRIETFFMGSTSVRDGCTYVGSAFDAQTKVALMDVSDQVILLVDSSKFSQTSLFPIAPIDRVNVVITDSGAPGAAMHELRTRGIDVIQVDVDPREAQDLVPATARQTADAER